MRHVYDNLGKSGTRIDGPAKTALSILKKAVIDELKQKGMIDYVPGVNIIVGLAEDSLALWKAVQMVSSGNQETKAIARQLNHKINGLNRELVNIGITRAQLYDRMKELSRTA